MKRFEGNSTIKSLVSVSCNFFSKILDFHVLSKCSFGALSTREDYESIVQFFEGKDTSKYSMSLAQALETIQTRIAYIEVCGRTPEASVIDLHFKRSAGDLTEWLENWDKRSKL
jgi:hypothetical protein